MGTIYLEGENQRVGILQIMVEAEDVYEAVKLVQRQLIRPVLMIKFDARFKCDLLHSHT